ncbi:ANTAR domain-containing response regulator [Butyrivibrio sp. FCS014]|uniref:ANTAR domain-containing response regulator n=1 Tax=Butyrivibrio sp. FCS014 TaxID=1408304 RepID=UPI000464BD7A|nr:ANTAR domain-containing protein [Butyrivibrio sp. FCS014]
MNIIVAFAKAQDTQNFKSILSRGGFDQVSTCTSGAQALSLMDDLGSGVIICGYRLSDMLYSQLLEDLPAYFKMVLVASAAKAPEEPKADNFIYLESPAQRADLFSTITLMMEGVSRDRRKAKERRMKRSDEDRKVIDAAKSILMERHHMTEPEAHKYLQKCAMDSGTDLLETAEMIISLTNI